MSLASCWLAAGFHAWAGLLPVLVSVLVVSEGGEAWGGLRSASSYCARKSS